MYLDEGARQWLALIEDISRRQQEAMDTARKLQASGKRVTSDKGKAKNVAAQQSNAEQLNQLTTALAAETENFFREVFGITKGCVVAMRSANGNLSATLIASNLVARQLVDGSGMFAVHGSSMTDDLTNGLPAHNLLSAKESMDERLVSIA